MTTADPAERSRAPLPEGVDVHELWRWVLAHWIVVAALGVLRDVVVLDPTSDLLVRSLLANVASAGLWAAVSVVAYWSTRSRRRVAARDLLGLGAMAFGVACAVHGTALWIFCNVAPREVCPTPEIRRALSVLFFPGTFAVTINLFAIGWALRGLHLSRLHWARARLVRTELLRSKMVVLERQLRPHFLFNTLQSVATLLHRDARTAREMLLTLRKLLEHSIAVSATAETSVAAEIQLIRSYLNIEQLRFGPRLTVSYAIEEDATRGSIPPFLIQPIVENAVHHAIALSGEGSIRVAAYTAAAGPATRLVIVVSDTGSGAGADTRGMGSGMGLDNARTRLRTLYGQEWSLDVETTPKEGGATTVTVSLPFRA